MEIFNESWRKWTIAVCLAISGVAIFGVAVAALAAGHGRFSLGVGIALLCYALIMFVISIGVLAGVMWLRGLVVMIGLLHILVLASTVNPTNAWQLILLVVPITQIASVFWPNRSGGRRS